MQDILDKFTSHLRQVIAKAHALATEMAAPRINPEHLFLALLHQKGSIGGEILRKADVSHEAVRRMMSLADEMAKMDGRSPEPTGTPTFSDDAKRAIEKAVLTANVNGHKYVGTEHLLSGLLQIDAMTVEAVLNDQNVDISDLKEQVATVMKSTSKFPEITETFDVGKAPAPKTAEAEQAAEAAVAAKKAEGKKSAQAAKKAAVKTPALDFFATELTNPKLQENIDPVIGRDKEVERVIQILCRRTKNNPVLLGEPGVGKTAIVEGLAKKILKGDVPEILADRRIFALDLGLILAGTIYRGEFEGRLKQIVDEMKANPEIFLFIDELHNIMGAGSTNGSMDAANILKPALARGDMRCIGATTLAEYKKHIEADGALERRFQPVAVNQPAPEDAVKILKGLRANYEEYHGVTITDAAIEAAVELSERYITDRFLPDKAIDLIDEAAACLRVATTTESDAKRAKEIEDELDGITRKKQKAVQGEKFMEALQMQTREKELETEMKALGKKEVKAKPKLGSIGRKDVAAVVARATGIPVNELIAEEKDRLLNLEALLRARVVGQEDAVKQVAELVRRAKAGISHPNRPLASFLFLGSSGVGKTELAKALAEIVFQDPNAMVRIDMSEFAEGFSASKLVGAPAGYVGYRDETKLTDVVKRKPHSLVLFDEIEKAHGDIHNLLLQILEDGHVTDATGRKINFKHTIIVMTSNVGSNTMRYEPMGFEVGKKGEVSKVDEEEVRAGVMKELESAFRPEFINRIDKTLVFKPLSQVDLESIVKLQLDELSKRLVRDYKVGLSWSPLAVAMLAEKSWNPLYGARGVRRQIQDLVENPLARELLGADYRAGDTMAVGVKDDAIAISKKKAVGGKSAAKVKAHA